MTYLTVENNTLRSIEWHRIKRRADKAGVNAYEAYLQYQDISGYIFEYQSEAKFEGITDDMNGQMNRDDADVVADMFGYSISYEVLQDVIEGFTCDDTMIHSMIAQGNAVNGKKRIVKSQKAAQARWSKKKETKEDKQPTVDLSEAINQKHFTNE